MCSRFWLNWSVKVWCVSLIDDLRKFSARSWSERGLFLEAFILLGVMRAAILLFPFRKIAKILGITQSETSSIPEKDIPIDTTAIGWAIQAAAARTHWESACLAQALTGMVMLSRRGVASALYLGVARVESTPGTMDAHAWLRCGDAILTGAGGVERFSAISAFVRQQPHNDRTGS
ncbi:MAG: lasso peptide biosynthesis B2 protein [Geobacteraceae bacterium]|nr:lasso peptide biosynthesis B2 protein [Geobacteraceae bacterium]